MNYELAKELKDAGFPQSNTVTFKEAPGATRTMQEMLDSGDYCTVPTLEELIEACGKHLSILRPYQDTWQANNSNSEDADFCSGEGSTPTIAVAKLWLALNPAQIIN